MTVRLSSVIKEIVYVQIFNPAIFIFKSSS